MKKHLLTLMLAVMCIFVLMLSVGAETSYTVSSNDEYQDAFENAVNGDTIIINGELTCDIQATKSVTYVLKADWKSAKMVVKSNVDVSFLADGGSYKIMPTGYDTTNGWLNLAEAYENVVINLAGINGTVTLDGTNAKNDTISYVTKSADLTWNFFSGSAIANFNPTTGSSSEYASIIYAGTFNMYDGSEIYANNIINAPLIRAVNFNLFGGEIFGNYLTSDRIKTSSATGVGAGAIYVTNKFVMYDGSIHGNIFNTQKTTGNVRGFISVPAGNTIVILGGALGKNYTKSTGADDISAIFGVDEKNDNVKSYFYYNSELTTGTRYFFTGTPELLIDEATGKTIWQVVSSVTLNKENWYGYCWKHIQGGSDKVAVFFDANKKTINGYTFDVYAPIDAFIIGIDAYANNVSTPSQKDYTYSYSGATELTIPGSSQLWSTSGTEYCHEGIAYTLDDINSSMPITLYKVYTAGKKVVNGTTMCAGDCGKVYSCENPDHEQQVSISYDKYTESGTKTLTCATCNIVNSSTVPALIVFKGYSRNYDNTKMCVGYDLNYSAIAEYKAVNSLEDIFEYGFVVTLAENVQDGKPLTVGENVVAVQAEKPIVKAEITNDKYTAVEFVLEGDFTSNLSTGILMAMYIYDGSDLVYVQSTADSESTEVDSIIAVAIESLSAKE